MSRLFGLRRLGIRSATQSPASSLLVILVVAATAFAGSSAPGLLQRAQTDTVRYGLGSTDPAQLDLTTTARGVPSPGEGVSSTATTLPDDLDSSWGSAFDELDSFRSGLDPELRAVLGAPRVVALLDRARIDPRPIGPAPLTELIVTVDPLLDSRVEYVEGDAPERNDAPVDVHGKVDDSVARPSLSIALSEEVAASLKWNVGEARVLDLPTTGGVDIELTGIFRALDPRDGAWGHLPASLRPSIEQPNRDRNTPLYVGTAFLSPDSLANVTDFSVTASFEAWFPFRIDAVEGQRTRTLRGLLRGFSAEAFSFSVDLEGGVPDDVLFASNAPRVLDATQPRVDGMRDILTVLASGPAAVAALTLVLATRILALRRRGSVGLARARGASLRALFGLLAVEGLVIGVLGASLGALIGLVSGDRGSGALIAPLVVAVIPAVALPVISVRLGQRRSRSGAPRRTGARRVARLVPELVLVVVSLVGVALVIARGRPDAGAGPGIDPLLTVLPVALATLGSLVTIRLLPVLLGRLESRARRSAGLIALLGPARARRTTGALVAPVLAVVVGSATAIFSGSFLASIDAGIDAAAHALVGADLRAVSDIPPPALDRIRAIEGIAAVAPVYGEQAVSGVVPDGRVSFRVYVIDAAEMRSVQGDAAWALPAPASLGEEAGSAVPVVASSELAARVGAENLEVQSTPLSIEAVAPSSGPLGFARMWVAVDRANADRIADEDYNAPVVLVDVGSDSTRADVEGGIRDVLGDSAVIETPTDAAVVRRDDPALGGVVSAVVAATGVVGVALALTIAITLVLGSGVRSRLLALLAAFGFHRRGGTLRLIIWEVAPVIAMAVPVGLLAGLVLAVVVLGSIDLTALVGGESPPAVVLAGPTTIVPFAGFLVVTAVSVAVAALVAGRASTTRAIRTFDDGAQP